MVNVVQKIQSFILDLTTGRQRAIRHTRRAAGRSRFQIVLMAALLVWGSVSLADVLKLNDDTKVFDALLRENVGLWNYGADYSPMVVGISSGSGRNIAVGLDLSGVTAATHDSTFYFWVLDNSQDFTSQVIVIAVGKLDSDIVEGINQFANQDSMVCWNHRGYPTAFNPSVGGTAWDAADRFWTNPGGDVVFNSDTLTLSGLTFSDGDTLSVDISTIVQDALDNGQDYCVFLLFALPGSGTTANVRYCPIERATAADRPYALIYYTPTDATPTALAVDDSSDCGRAILTWTAPVGGSDSIEVFRDDVGVAVIDGALETYIDSADAGSHTWSLASKYVTSWSDTTATVAGNVYRCYCSAWQSLPLSDSSYVRTMDSLDAFFTAHPEWEDDTIAVTDEGQYIRMPTLSPTGFNQTFWVTTVIHAGNELTTLAGAFGLLEHLADSAQYLYPLARIAVVVLLNPKGAIDSLRIAGTGGVDLNRNFPAGFGVTEDGCSSGIPGEYNYRGPYALSENETQGLSVAIIALNPVIGIDTHTNSDRVIYYETDFIARSRYSIETAMTDFGFPEVWNFYWAQYYCGTLGAYQDSLGINSIVYEFSDILRETYPDGSTERQINKYISVVSVFFELQYYAPVIDTVFANATSDSVIVMFTGNADMDSASVWFDGVKQSTVAVGVGSDTLPLAPPQTVLISMDAFSVTDTSLFSLDYEFRMRLPTQDEEFDRSYNRIPFNRSSFNRTEFGRP